ncbi:hypothetical protein [Duganella sp. Dugasp56]|uniref:hypothetical protein n=1 Tax=Duganella sp. Dugasp56 TaxID=3243046 RepID=UPI0039AF59AE
MLKASLAGVLLIGLSNLTVTAIAQGVASEAQRWAARTDAEKAGYIDALCDTYPDFPNTTEGDLFCKPFDGKGKQVARFCSARWSFTKPHVADPAPGIRIFNQFYADKNHSDLPAWAVVAAYNDKACGESKVLPRLAAMQAKLLCLRQASGMAVDRYPTTAIDAQNAVCRAMK